MITTTTTKGGGGRETERRLNDLEYLFLQGTGISQNPHSGLQISITPLPGYPILLSNFQEHYAHMSRAYTHIHM